MQRGQILIGQSFLYPFERIGDKKTYFGEEARNSCSCAKIKAGFGWLAVIELTFF